MPRGYLKEKEYKADDLKKFIYHKAKDNNVTIKTLAELVGCARGTFYKKLEEGSLTYKDLLQVFKALKATGDEITKLLTM